MLLELSARFYSDAQEKKMLLFFTVHDTRQDIINNLEIETISSRLREYAWNHGFEDCQQYD